MARYHCDTVGQALQKIKGVEVTAITDSSWEFNYNSARVRLRILPGCCGVLLAYNFSGLAKDLNRLLVFVGKAATVGNFGIVLLTLQSKSQLRVSLKPELWASVKSFINPRTKNALEVITYSVKPPKVKKIKQTSHSDDY